MIINRSNVNTDKGNGIEHKEHSEVRHTWGRNLCKRGRVSVTLQCNNHTEIYVLSGFIH